MMRAYCVRPLVCLTVVGLTGLWSLSGCTPHNYKRQADEQVYRIIDQKWDKSFGTKANYKISDTPPSPNDVQIGKEPTTFKVLTLAQAVALATAHNRQYQTQKEALYVKALDLRLTRHEFETQFFGGATGGYNADRNDEAAGAETGAGFNRLLAGGTQISTALTGAWVDVLTGNLRSGLASILSATVAQPLLRGSDRRVVVENLTQAERDTLYQVRSFNRYRKTFVVSVISQYYGVLERYDVVKHAQNYYMTLAWLDQRVKDLADAGRVPLHELDQVRQEKLLAANTYSQAQRTYEQALDDFKITLTLPPTAKLQLDEKEFDALKQTITTQPEFPEAKVVQAALLQRLDVANSADAVIDAQRKIFVAADSLRGQADLVATASVPSARRADRQRLGWLAEEYGIGAELDLPLDRVAEQNVYRKALITLNKRQRDYDQAADTVTLEVRQAHRDLTEAAERYKVSTDALELAQKRFNNTFLLLQYSRASSRRVLDAQNDLFDAQNDASQALLDYTVATLNFYRDTGALRVLPDGMWKL
jgi:outer membrane protein TolC